MTPAVKVALLLILAALCLGCNGDPVAPTPVATPSPEPTPAPVEACEALRADIFAELDGKTVYAWPLGEVPTLTAALTYRGDLAGLDTSDCEGLVVVTWIKPQPPEPYCEIQGNQNSPRIRLQCFEPGTITVEAHPQGFTIVPAVASFRVQP